MCLYLSAVNQSMAVREGGIVHVCREIRELNGSGDVVMIGVSQ